MTGPINLGNPQEFTILELAKKVIAMPGSRSRIQYRPLPTDDPTQRHPDIAKARQVLDWQPTTPLDKGLEKTIGYFRQLVG